MLCHTQQTGILYILSRLKVRQVALSRQQSYQQPVLFIPFCWLLLVLHHTVTDTHISMCDAGCVHNRQKKNNSSQQSSASFAHRMHLVEEGSSQSLLHALVTSRKSQHQHFFSSGFFWHAGMGMSLARRNRYSGGSYWLCRYPGATSLASNWQALAYMQRHMAISTFGRSSKNGFLRVTYVAALCHLTRGFLPAEHHGHLSTTVLTSIPRPTSSLAVAGSPRALCTERMMLPLPPDLLCHRRLSSFWMLMVMVTCHLLSSPRH